MKSIFVLSISLVFCIALYSQTKQVVIEYHTPWSVEAGFVITIFSDGKVVKESKKVNPVELDASMEFDESLLGVPSTNDETETGTAIDATEVPSSNDWFSTITETAQIGSREIFKIQDVVANTKFSTLKPRYTANVLDDSTYSISVRTGSEVHSVDVYALDYQTNDPEIRAFISLWNYIAECLLKIDMIDKEYIVRG